MDSLEHVQRLVEMARGFPGPRSRPGDPVTTRKAWCARARTFTYHTHIAAEGLEPDHLDRVADAFFRAADLAVQPWYAQFRGGESRITGVEPPVGIDRQQLCLSSFDVGLGKPRCYRVLVSLASPKPQVRVVSLRSVDLDWPVPSGAVLAETLEPSGDVFEWRDGQLHWHHICTTPGVALLPDPLDRWLLNTMRRLGLDGKERATYREEAEAWRRWVTSGLGPVEACEGTSRAE